MSIKEAYLKVLGLDNQKPLQEEKQSVERAAWVPASIADEQVQAFMEAVKSALADKQEVVHFEGKKWKVAEKKSCAAEGSMMKKDDDGEEEEGEDDETEIVPTKKGKDVKEELKGDQHKLDKNKNGKLDSDDFKKLRKEGKYAELIATLSEGGLADDEIEGIVARLEEKAHVGTGGPAPAEPQEMGDNLSDGEIDFVETHEVEVVDGTPEKPDFDKDLDKAEEPKAQGAAKVEVDGKKAAEKQPVTTTKAAVPTTK